MEGIEKESSEQIIQKRKEKIFSWLKKPENLIFSLIFLGIIILRFYYFWITKNQPVWWDE